MDDCRLVQFYSIQKDASIKKALRNLNELKCISSSFDALFCALKWQRHFSMLINRFSNDPILWIKNSSKLWKINNILLQKLRDPIIHLALLLIALLWYNKV